MSWTDERIELLKKLWSEGRTASDIADQLAGDISRNAVIGKVHRLGLSTRPSPIIRKGPSERGTNRLTLTERMCRWPFGDPKNPDFYFCGRAVDVSVTYCAEHRAIAYAPVRKPLVTAKG